MYGNERLPGVAVSEQFRNEGSIWQGYTQSTWFKVVQVNGSEALDIPVGTIMKEVLADVEAGKVEFKVEYDDIHGCIEQVLEEKIGPVARKLNWARSVNDQVVIDTRLFLRAENERLQQQYDGIVSSREALERHARETAFFVESGDEVYLIDE